MVDRHAHARRVGLHEATIDVGIVQNREAGFKLLFGFGDFQYQSFAGSRIAICKRTENSKALIARQPGNQFSYRHMKEFSQTRTKLLKHCIPLRRHYCFFNCWPTSNRVGHDGVCAYGSCKARRGYQAEFCTLKPDRAPDALPRPFHESRPLQVSIRSAQKSNSRQRSVRHPDDPMSIR